MFLPRPWFLATVALIGAISCKRGVNERFIAFLKEEQRMRDRIQHPYVLQDSLEALEQRFKINKDAELEHLKKNPDLWVEVLKAFMNEPAE
jgi:hypothetical protein